MFEEPQFAIMYVLGVFFCLSMIGIGFHIVMNKFAGGVKKLPLKTKSNFTESEKQKALLQTVQSMGLDIKEFDLSQVRNDLASTIVSIEMQRLLAEKRGRIKTAEYLDKYRTLVEKNMDFLYSSYKTENIIPMFLITDIIKVDKVGVLLFGCFINGTLQVGNKVVVKDMDGYEIPTTVEFIVSHGKIVDKIFGGETAGIVLKGIRKVQVKPTDVVLVYERITGSHEFENPVKYL